MTEQPSSESRADLEYRIERAQSFVRAGRQAFHTLASGPSGWESIPDAMIKQDKIDDYEVQVIADEQYGTEHYIDILRKFGHASVDAMCNALEDWARNEGERPDLLVSVNERLRLAKVERDGK